MSDLGRQDAALAEVELAVANRRAELRRKTPISFWGKSAYGTGAMVDGLVSCAVNLFLFFYLTAVCGLSGALTGMSLFVALVVDAVADPLVGSLSDNTVSPRWGRRHPFMLLSAPIIAVALGLLFSLPDSLRGLAAFAYVTTLSIVLRCALSGFFVPYAALGAELTDDYVERSSVVSYRLFLGTVGSIICMGMGPLIFFRGHDGLLHRGAYPWFAWTCGGLMLIAAAVCVRGTLPMRERLHQTAPSGANPLTTFWRGMAELCRNPSFVALFVSQFIYFVALGVENTLTFHTYLYFWRLPQGLTQTITIASCIGTPLGVWLNSFTAPRFEKRTVVIAGVLINCVSDAVLPVLKMVGLTPEPGMALYAIMVANAVVLGAVVTTESIAFYSMLADAADEHEHRFGHRREGLYFSGLSFAIKASSGLGSLIGGVALDLIHFPAGVASRAVGSIPASTLLELGLIRGPLAAVLMAVCLIPMLAYRLTRRSHAQIQFQLSERRQAIAEGRVG